jgi:tetratricopeptide (TPR) repeat protein
MKRFNILLSLAFVCIAAQAFSQTAEELNRRGAELAGKKQFDQALEFFRRAAAMQDAQSAKVFHNRGWVMELQGNVNGALENYREAVRRNPNLADSYERMGYWFYKAGKYADAVAMGEKVTKIDPANQEVKKWIADAYRKKLEHPGAPVEAVEEKPSPTTVAAEPKPQEKKPETAAPKDEKKEKKQIKLYATFDLTARTGYYYNDSQFKFVQTNGAMINLPYTLDFYFKPLPGSDTRFEFTTGNPILAAGIPRVVSQFERTEGVFSFGPFGIGGGILISHYYDDFNFGEKKLITDVKIGPLLEYNTNETSFSLRVYPRFIPLFYDDKSSTGKTMDACTLEMIYRYILDEEMSYYSRITANDYYFFDNTINTANYWGYYDVAVGLTLGNKGAILGKDVNVTIELGKRVYLQKLNNTKPYNTMNGMGYFGFDKSHHNGKYFSGYRATSNIFSFSADEAIHENIFIYQKLNVEFVDRHNKHSEFSLTFGVGGKL